MEEVALTQEALDLRFRDVVARAVSPFPRISEESTPTMDDSNKTFRTRLVAFWLLTNAILVAVIMNLYSYRPREKLDTEAREGRQNQEIYFKVMLWSTFGLAFFRFMGCVLFWLRRQMTRCCLRT